MKTIQAKELNKKPGAALRLAQKEPILVTQFGVPTLVLISYEKYLKLTKGN